jgi:hypothetical protein
VAKVLEIPIWFSRPVPVGFVPAVWISSPRACGVVDFFYVNLCLFFRSRDTLTAEGFVVHRFPHGPRFTVQDLFLPLILSCWSSLLAKAIGLDIRLAW